MDDVRQWLASTQTFGSFWLIQYESISLCLIQYSSYVPPAARVDASLEVVAAAAAVDFFVTTGGGGGRDFLGTTLAAFWTTTGLGGTGFGVALTFSTATTGAGLTTTFSTTGWALTGRSAGLGRSATAGLGGGGVGLGDGAGGLEALAGAGDVPNNLASKSSIAMLSCHDAAGVVVVREARGIVVAVKAAAGVARTARSANCVNFMIVGFVCMYGIRFRRWFPLSTILCSNYCFLYYYYRYV